MSLAAAVLIFILKWIGGLLVLTVSVLYAFKLYVEPHRGKCRCKTDLTGKVAIITGGNSGIGLETARDLAWRGARVIIASRNTKKSIEAVNDIKKTSGNDKVEHRYLDLSKFASVRAFAEEINQDLDRLDILVNNAGAVGVNHRLTEDGNEMIMQTNHLGPFLLTNLLLDKLISSRPSRIVIVSSLAHEFSYFYPEHMQDNYANSYLGPLFFFITYANTKLCNVLWARTLARRLPEGVTVNALHPGLVTTNIIERLPVVIRVVIRTVIRLMFKTAIEGAQTTVHVCVSPELEGVSGKYFNECRMETTKAGSDHKLAEFVWQRSVELTESGKTL